MNKNVFVRGAGLVCTAVLMLGGAASAASASTVAPEPEVATAATADAALEALVHLDLAGLVDALIPSVSAEASVNAEADVDADVDATAKSDTSASVSVN
ncbi:hypothetical protein [Streptomyces sp. N35]|uniref:hypothetical protein n=1 Tax=Streptomyces sp. N35 TaxID=2795730 RepID=UPI0018F44BDB|nr:hypothetical protein [Streptomyces sp. N35]